MPTVEHPRIMCSSFLRRRRRVARENCARFGSFLPIVGTLTAFGALTFALVRSGRSQDYASDDAVRHMKAADGFRVNLVAAEPTIRKPVAIEFDDRGRL